MTSEEILALMAKEPALRLFPTMKVGGRMAQLSSMEHAGLISSRPRYAGRHRQRDWFLSEAQWHRAKRIAAPEGRYSDDDDDY